MDYRFVKQQYNYAIDNFFNVFYKFWDMLRVLYDAFWLIIEIFYNFFGIFTNIYLYFYFLFLLILEKLSLLQSPLFFWRHFHIRSGSVPRKAYQEHIFNPIPARYGRFESPVSKPSSISNSAAAAASVAARAAKPGRNIFKIIFTPFIFLFSAIIKGIVSVCKAIAYFFTSRLRPTKEQPIRGRKNLVNQYMKEYEQKKGY